MHQQYQLPPRPPFQRRAEICPLDEPISNRANNKSNGHKKSFSQGLILGDQPEWLDDLLSDSDTNTRGSYHSRSSSDPMISLYDGLLPMGIIPFYDDGYDESLHIGRVNENLPLSEEGYMSREHGRFGSTNNLNTDPNQGKRHPRQRSRVRKLHYIAELDKKVNDLQVMVSELQLNASTLLQQRLILSVENTKLKQHASELQQQKLFLDDEYQTLRKEAERLKSGLARMHKASNYSWEMLDWRKLDLG